MILRPVRPVSAWGPPSSKTPVGLARTRRFEWSSSGGSSGSMTLVRRSGQQQGLEVDARVVLGGDQHGLEGDRAAVLVGHRDLGLAVGAQVGQGADPAHLGQALRQPVGQPDGERHQVGRLVAGVAEHHPLVAGTLGVQLVLAAGARPDLERLVDALADVGRLLVERDDDAAGVAVDAVRVVVVPDVEHGLADQLGDVDVRRGGDLTGDEHQPGGQQGLAGHPAVGIVGQQCVQDRVRDLVGHLVGVPFGHGLRSEGVSAAHGSFHPLWSGRRALVRRRRSAILVMR